MPACFNAMNLFAYRGDTEQDKFASVFSTMPQQPTLVHRQVSAPVGKAP